MVVCVKNMTENKKYKVSFKYIWIFMSLIRQFHSVIIKCFVLSVHSSDNSSTVGGRLKINFLIKGTFTCWVLQTIREG